MKRKIYRDCCSPESILWEADEEEEEPITINNDNEEEGLK
jgi:hypothetical protein